MSQFLTDPARMRALVATHGTPLLLLSTQVIRHQYRILKEAMPGVQLHYALKPLPHPAVIKALLEEGAFFDLATNGEVDVVRAVGVPAERCIQSHPIKRDSDISYTLGYGCRTFVFDNPYELPKFLPYKDQVELLMRLSFRNKEAQADLSAKFGVHPTDALELLRKAVDAASPFPDSGLRPNSLPAMALVHPRTVDLYERLIHGEAPATREAPARL